MCTHCQSHDVEIIEIPRHEYIVYNGVPRTHFLVLTLRCNECQRQHKIKRRLAPELRRSIAMFLMEKRS